MPRTAMTQPNVYFTLNTPFATLIGLYTNVPEGGVVKADQLDWFIGELQAADPDLPVIVGMHHPIHSLDAFHSGSRPMAKILAKAEQNAGRMADLVCAGHVHNYQRFSARDANGVRPFIVAGFGGYHNMHRMQQVGGADPVAPYVAPNDPNVTLENYVDDRFGFLRLDISKSEIAITTYTVPRPQEPYRTPPRRRDHCCYDWRRRAFMP